MKPSRKRNAAGAEAVDVAVTGAEAAVVAAAAVEVVVAVATAEAVVVAAAEIAAAVVVVTAAIAAIAGNVASPPTSSSGVIYFAAAFSCSLLSRRFLHASCTRSSLVAPCFAIRNKSPRNVFETSVEENHLPAGLCSIFTAEECFGTRALQAGQLRRPFSV